MTEVEDSATATRVAPLGTTFVRYVRAATAAPITEDDYHLFDEIWVASQLEDVDETNRWRRLGFRTEAPQFEFDRVGLLGLKMLKRFAEDSQNEFAKVRRFPGAGCVFRRVEPLIASSHADPASRLCQDFGRGRAGTRFDILQFGAPTPARRLCHAARGCIHLAVSLSHGRVPRARRSLPSAHVGRRWRELV